MSLLVSTFVRDAATGEYVGLPLAPDGGHLAGVEACRRTLWGSSAAVKLGLELLPTLARYDLYVEHDQLDAFEREIRLVLDHLADFARATGYTDEYIEDRATNILEAIARAREHPTGGVTIF